MKDEPPAPKDPGKPALRARLDAMAAKIDPERATELEAEYSARVRRNQEAAERLSDGDQQRPKAARRRPSTKQPTSSRGRTRSGARPVRRAATPSAEGTDPDKRENIAGAKELAVLAKATWAAAHDDAECPPDHIPTLHDMARQTIRRLGLRSRADRQRPDGCRAYRQGHAADQGCGRLGRSAQVRSQSR